MKLSQCNLANNLSSKQFSNRGSCHWNYYDLEKRGDIYTTYISSRTGQSDVTGQVFRKYFLLSLPPPRHITPKDIRYHHRRPSITFLIKFCIKILQVDKIIGSFIYEYICPSVIPILSTQLGVLSSVDLGRRPSHFRIRPTKLPPFWIGREIKNLFSYVTSHLCTM